MAVQNMIKMYQQPIKKNNGPKAPFNNGTKFSSISNRQAMFGGAAPRKNNSVKKNNNRKNIPNGIVARGINAFGGAAPKKNNAPVAKPPSLANRYKMSVNANMAKRNANALAKSRARYNANMKNAGLNHAVNILRSKIKPGGMANTFVRSMANKYMKK